jgi:YVTN family beta-propeller protein
VRIAFVGRAVAEYRVAGRLRRGAAKPNGDAATAAYDHHGAHSGASTHSRADALAPTATAAPTLPPAPTATAVVINGVAETRIADAAAKTLTVGGYPDWLEVGFGSLWVSNPLINAVQRIDLTSGEIITRISVQRPCAAMSIGFGSLWVASCELNEIHRIDPQSNRVIARIWTPLATSESSISAGEGGVWLVSAPGEVLTRIDPTTNKVVASIKVKDRSSSAMAGFGAIWVTTAAGREQNGTVQRVDPLSNRVVATITVGFGPRFLAAGEGGVWVLNQFDGTVSRIDPKTNTVVATIEAGVVGDGGDIAVGEGGVWVRGSGVLLVVIDPATNNVVKRFGPAQGSGAVRAGGGQVWVSAHNVTRIWALNPSLK